MNKGILKHMDGTQQFQQMLKKLLHNSAKTKY